MVGPGLERGEHLIRESPEITIREIQFTLYLTDRRLLFWHAAKKNRFGISRKDLVDVEFYETEAGEPLFVITYRGRKKIRGGDGREQVIMIFSGQSGLPRSDEAEVLFSFIHAIARQNQRISEGRAKKKGRTTDDLLPDGQHCSCGKKFTDDTSFCTFCGTRIVRPVKKDRNKSPLFSFGSTKKPVDTDDNPVPSGEEVSSVHVPCRRCLEPIPDNSVFCKYCGAKQTEQTKPEHKPGFSLSRLFKAKNNRS